MPLSWQTGRSGRDWRLACRRVSGCTSGNLARDLLQEAFQAAIAPSVSIADSLLRFLISGIAVLADQLLRVFPNRLFHLSFPTNQCEKNAGFRPGFFSRPFCVALNLRFVAAWLRAREVAHEAVRRPLTERSRISCVAWSFDLKGSLCSALIEQPHALAD